MRKLAFILALLLALCLPVAVRAEEDRDPFNVNQALFYADFEATGGTAYKDIYVQNVIATPQTITVSPWVEYTYPDAEATGGWIDPAWIVSITPSVLTLQPGQNALFSVCISLPASAPDKVFKTWVKVSNGELNRPITIWIRKGDAVPTYSFALASGSAVYTCNVTDYGGGAINHASPIGIKSTCKTTTKFQASLETPGWIDPVTNEECHDDVITQARVDDPSSVIFHGKQEEVGNTYLALDLETAAEWIKLGDDRVPATLANPLVVKPYETGNIPWGLTIPDSVENGHYWVWVRIKPAEETGQNITTNYVSKIYITVDRGRSIVERGSMVWFGGAVGVCLLAFAGWWGLPKLVSRLSKHPRLRYGGSRPHSQVVRGNSRPRPHNAAR